jgi:hypothetical protein
VERSCDSDWVTCIEDAWVVSFRARPDCPVKGDERLGVTLLIDGKSGRVISRFPELTYFQQPQFCMEDYDCLLSPSSSPSSPDGTCYNFIFAPLHRIEEKKAEAHSSRADSVCVCRNQQCQYG